MSRPDLTAKKPTALLERPLKIDFRQLFKALTKGVGHTAAGKWDELAADTMEVISSIRLSTEPSELAFTLIRRAITKAVFDLVGDSANRHIAEGKKLPVELSDDVDASFLNRDIYLDKDFLEHPGKIRLVADTQTVLKEWMERNDIDRSTAEAIAGRLPGYFVFALNQEWRSRADYYQPLLNALDTPFSNAGQREWSWLTYAAQLQREISEGIFDEPFSLQQIYVPLNAYYEEISGKQIIGVAVNARKRRRVVELESELNRWLTSCKAEDAIRVISGGPGSGKSSFARIFAARVASSGKARVLFIPLHLIDPTRDFVGEVERLVTGEAILAYSPLDPQASKENLLLILDGLDELTSQGKAAAEIAKNFIWEIEKLVETRNRRTVRLRVLFSGRELIIQENQSEFRRQGQVLTLLPYYVANAEWMESRDDFDDPNNLLATDLRQRWWKNYGSLSGKEYNGLPKQLQRPDLDEITAQPLLNYLVALSLNRGSIDFTRNVNINEVYADLIGRVHERGYEKGRRYVHVRHLTVDEFVRVLEEIGLAAWHSGDGRSSTMREIEERCHASGVSGLLEIFQEGAKVGLTHFLAAFFFRQYGQRPSGDRTFVFTHKSFGEYLAARRVVRAIERIVRELNRRGHDPDDGWDERTALKHLVQICGASPISPYLHAFVLNECRLRSKEDMAEWQVQLGKLFGYMLRHGVSLEFSSSFKETLRQSRNAEEALLGALNACARVTKEVSFIEHFDSATFGSWLKRVQGQRSNGRRFAVVDNCLSYLNLGRVSLEISDLYGANLKGSILCNSRLQHACLIKANLEASNLEGADLSRADLEEASLSKAKLGGAVLENTNLRNADLKNAKLRRANLWNANLANTDLSGADLQEACLSIAILENAKLKAALLQRANLTGTRLWRANLQKADLRANLQDADFSDANLEGANLERANLVGASLEGANLKRSNLEEANLCEANLDRTDLTEALLRKAKLSGARLIRADLTKTNAEGAILERANLRGAKLNGTNLSGADLRGADLRSVDLHKANLAGANVTGATLKGSNLDGTILQGVIGLGKSHTPRR